MAIRNVSYNNLGVKIKDETLPIEKERVSLILAKHLTDDGIKQLFVHYTLTDGTSHSHFIADEIPDTLSM